MRMQCACVCNRACVHVHVQVRAVASALLFLRRPPRRPLPQQRAQDHRDQGARVDAGSAARDPAVYATPASNTPACNTPASNTRPAGPGPASRSHVRASAWPGIIRSCILLSIIADSADVQFAQIFAAESIVVTGFVAVSPRRDPTQPSTPIRTLTLALTLARIPSRSSCLWMRCATQRPCCASPSPSASAYGSSAPSCPAQSTSTPQSRHAQATKPRGVTCYVANRRHHAAPPPPRHPATPHRMHMLTCCAFAGQWPLLLEGPLRDAFMGVGSATKQSTIASIDWTITLMLFSSVLSVRNHPDEMDPSPSPGPGPSPNPSPNPNPHQVLNYPGEMAVVRMRCDTKVSERT